MERAMGRFTQITLLICGAWLTFEAVQVMRDIRRLAEEVPAVLDAAVAREAEYTRAELAEQSNAWRRMATDESRRARLAAVAESAAWRKLTGAEIAATRSEVLAAVDRQGAALIATVGPTADAATAALDEYRRVPAAVTATLSPWMECRGNGACIPAQLTALLGASRATAGEASRTMRTIRESTPAIVGNADKITSNVERLTRPDRLAVRILKLAAPIFGGALFGAIK